ncbi:histidine--tRNA ligase [Clostridium tagluense]|uniref:histidine--tRNA ligase n=1 Tax=Clostridium tagluense TaxID=360422 RepID=UPI001CF3A8A0|nr:histidine--tRNA ligase [Clostridium tagluense]MCB2309747.1 histidine--tRNA ligase [Clostridium tagluense]MCB2314723.1 histidine--tRNA ligase [Clostridium tagluense]MCB2319572.1 histidine--tRNA ligase [Clostridium tagluense]MCB2324341.1 histidine--tRNA ligase [Clostridium tagluense]MCB2329192.1 histidine--tRNA ligase [Clostridium tagluense]
MDIQAPKGTKDILPENIYKWQYVENLFRKLCSVYGCREIRTPMFEHTELFKRGVGETTDVVQKEMYTFEDKGGRSITLKPEGTAPAVRAFIENGLFNEVQPTKLYYFTPCFRYEKMQKGRFREHHQFGVEVCGSVEASIDAEVISLVMRVYKEFGIEGVQLKINSMGCPSCRKKYNEALKEFLGNKYEELCETCKSRFEKNPLRILDCKVNSCKGIVSGAPIISDYICDGCSTHFESLKNYLRVMEIHFDVDPLIVRGLDYYTKTVFEVLDKNGLALCGGGRYDNLIKQIGGPDVPAMGFGMGIERLLMSLEENNIEIPSEKYMELYVGSMNEASKCEAIKIVNSLREKGIKCECDHMDKSVKAQMKYANKIEAYYTIILGEDEIKTRIAKIKRMSDGQQFEIKLDMLQEIIDIVKA